ncbi:MAG: flagellar brake protein [Candidatus Desulfatibia sp.]|uniref:flagellar brake protein n=1 Tax=Candidatus Desulfatibia sp. TaxID=3101189 RepID=UPI002F34C700
MTDGVVNNFGTDMRMSIEIGDQLQIEVKGIPSRYQTTFIGMELNEYFIIKEPVFPHELRVSGIKHKLFPGNEITVRYIYKGSVFGFQTKLIEAIFTPKRLLLIEYPKAIEKHNLRSTQRIDCYLPAITKIKNKETPGIILDINKKGCRYMIKAAENRKLPVVQKDDQIALRCHFPGNQDEQMVSGKVKNIKRDSQEMILGIEFLEMTVELHNIIEQYISTVK